MRDQSTSQETDQSRYILHREIIHIHVTEQIGGTHHNFSSKTQKKTRRGTPRDICNAARALLELYPVSGDVCNAAPVMYPI